MEQKIDILLATYNGEPYLKQLLDSLLAQTSNDWRLIIHDDSSVDGTVSIINEYAAAFPAKVIHLDDGVVLGEAKKNFLHLLNASDSPYVMFCDQDDVWQPEKVQIMYDEMVRNEQNRPGEGVLIHSDLEVVDANLNTISDSFWRYQGLHTELDGLSYVAVQNMVTGCSMMVNRPLINMIGKVPDSAIMHDWWLAMVAAAFGVIARVDLPLVRYRQHGANTVGAKEHSLRRVMHARMRFGSKSYRSEYVKALALSQKQAEDFLSEYREKLDRQQKEMLSVYTCLNTYSWIMRRVLIIKYKLLRRGISRIINMLIMV